MTTFENLGINNELVKGIKDLGFDNPMPIQEKVIPVLLNEKRDIIGLAQTGTGKTAAFGLPIIQSIDSDSTQTQALILAPTRELCLQIADDLRNYAKYIQNLNIVTVYGGAEINTQIKAIRKGAHIIVATPGRMHDLLNRRKEINLSMLQTVVLDEADEMLSMGFREELDAILDQTPDSKNTQLFSATMPQEVRELSKKYLNNPIEISSGKLNTGADNVEHIYYAVHEKNRYLALKRIVDFNPEIYGIIFCRTRGETKEVAQKLIQDGYNVEALHGDLSQPQREHIMQKFRVKNLQLLTATDVAARGIDVKELTHIINYNLPDESIGYIHRSGRTGRAGHKGISIAIINLKEKSKIRQIEARLKKNFTPMSIPDGNEICEKQLFNFIGRLENTEVDHPEINNFLPAINQKLASLDREDLIKHIVALEFKHLLNYYQKAEDLMSPFEAEEFKSREKRKDKKSSSNRQREANGSRKIRAEDGFTRFFINLGQKDSLTPQELIGLVIRSTRQKNVDIGKIDIMKSFSFFEVDEYYTQAVLTGFKNLDFKKRKVVVELTKDETELAPLTAIRKSQKSRKSMQLYI
jgi:ATP-dependent RNA helicase DeaD